MSKVVLAESVDKAKVQIYYGR